jgi:DUF1365 family protein
MTRFASCLYFGEVVHQRFSPRSHRLRYPVFQGLFDLDELPSLARRLRFFSHNRPNLFSFHDTDHGDSADGPLRAYVERLLTQAGLSVEGGKIALLCMPRILGFVFNPLSIFYCYARNGDLTAVLYEVNNTFGQRHSYLIPVEAPIHGILRQTCNKEFYVSPFMTIDMTYDFELTAPGVTLATRIYGNDAGGAPMIFATFTGARREFSDMTLLTALATYPLLTVGVVAAIHWEALKLLAKGLRLRRRPSPPPTAVTIVGSPAATREEARHAEGLDGLHKMDKQSA